MTDLTVCAYSPGTVRDAAAHTESHLAVHAPQLRAAFRAALPQAAAAVGRRLLGALWREDFADTRIRYDGRGHRHAFDRVEFEAVPADDPVDLLPSSIVDGRGWTLAAELANAVANLAIAYARRSSVDPAGDGPDAEAVALERLAIDGHNLHPCGRTRIGWNVDDVLAHDLEAGTTRIGFVALPRDAHVGDDLGALLGVDAPRGFVAQPVHAWQRDAVLARRHPEVRILDGDVPAVPTAALRTLLLPDGRYLKLSLDIQVTSSRRSISVASTHNGPALSTLLTRLLAAEERVTLLAETAGAALDGSRDASAILRDGLTAHLAGGERVVPGSALPLLAGDLLDEHGGGPLAFLTDYARLVLPPLLRLATRHGIALEAHLQNCLPTFVAGVPHRLVLRDLAGLRLHRPRLAATGAQLTLWPGSVIGTDDLYTMRAKLGYTAFQAHLGELVIALTRHGLDEAAAWRAVREVVDETYEPLRADPATARAAAADHAAFTAPRVPHKALVRMRLTGAGDVYIPVRNPLHAP
ncbi:IucA/IucC family protein [Phytohabitans sp. ZYX-F-186]|uniref:IucA/IucC family protein n=1 Tax=Phytohabitans maris TaxID=3071409 RepID=A0ABU0ZGL1_9ACTN|nr:IucA/IucC family protein [Phytohabitans sp. ZYX-F-186]MDQ7906160.1 IucA/IucC family protein [Phytohabitans sp. ZYX-F-186]